MQKLLALLLSLCLLCALFPTAVADDAGALSETELIAWIDRLLLDTRNLQPLNAPVGEESLTEDGYAFLYDFATLYYDKPVLDKTSVLQAVSLTDSSYAAPRGIRIGSEEDTLIATFGWQNPYLMGDSSFAAFYRTEDLPRAAYWSWAQHDDEWKLTSVQCAMHVQVGSGRYTDAGVLFSLENRTVTGVRVYGLNRLIGLEDVQANLNAVAGVERAALRAMDEHVEGYSVISTAEIFSEKDLTFAGMDFHALTASDLEKALGEKAQTETVQDGDRQLISASWADVDFIDETDSLMDTLSVSSSRLAGPRGIRVGDAVDAVLNAFASDGEARVLGSQAILYGDGVSAPCGVMEQTPDGLFVSYTAHVENSEANATLTLQFDDGLLTEWTLYLW